MSPTSALQLQGESSDGQNTVPPPPVYPDILANAALANQPGINPMTMSGMSGKLCIESLRYLVYLTQFLDFYPHNDYTVC